MSDRNFMEMLKAKWAEGKFVCVGLDSDFKQIPEKVLLDSGGSVADIRATFFRFNKMVVEETAQVACAYKINSAFYEAMGPMGMESMRGTVSMIARDYPDIPIIYDAKRADIGSTNEGYVSAIFGCYQFDAVTLHPYLGREALEPFLSKADKGFFILCRTSNPGAGEFQDLQIDKKPLYQIVAENVASSWNSKSNCGVVVGATYPDELARVREIVGDMPILIPGVGAQGGDVTETVRAGKNSRGDGFIVNSSRAIIFAKQREPERYANTDMGRAVHLEAVKLHQQIHAALA